jgi:hypothetical protein
VRALRLFPPPSSSFRLAAQMKCERAAETRRVAPFNPLVGKLESRIAPKQGLEDDRSLCAREARPEAVVDSAAEREVLLVGAIDVKPIGLREACRIPIGGA